MTPCMVTAGKQKLRTISFSKREKDLDYRLVVLLGFPYQLCLDAVMFPVTFINAWNNCLESTNLFWNRHSQLCHDCTLSYSGLRVKWNVNLRSLFYSSKCIEGLCHSDVANALLSNSFTDINAKQPDTRQPIDLHPFQSSVLPGGVHMYVSWRGTWPLLHPKQYSVCLLNRHWHRDRMS